MTLVPRIFTTRLSLLAFSCFALVAASARAQQTGAVAEAAKPATIKLGTGYDYSRGDYGFTQETEVSSIPLNLSYDQDRWAFRANLSWLTIKGPASVAAGSTPVAVPGRPTTSSQSGFGDVNLSASYHALHEPGQLNLDLTGRVKLPTADEDKGLGTGLTDAYAQIDLYQSFGSFTPLFTVGYRFSGSNAAYPLKDGPYISGGLAYLVSKGIVIGAVYDWRSKIVSGTPDAQDAVGFASVDLNEKWNLLGYVIAGFNDAAPDFGLGAGLTYRF